MDTWSSQDAKAKLSQLVKSCQSDGPQVINLQGEAIAIIMSQTDYEHLTRRRETLVDFMRHSPLLGLELDIER